MHSKKPRLTDKTEASSVVFYDIWPGNRVGHFLQPQCPHWTAKAEVKCSQTLPGTFDITTITETW